MSFPTDEEEIFQTLQESFGSPRSRPSTISEVGRGRPPQASEGFYSFMLPDGSYAQAPLDVSEADAYQEARSLFPDSFLPVLTGPIDTDSSPLDAFLATATRTTRGIFPGLKAAYASAIGDEEMYDAAQREIEEASLLAAEIAPSLTSTKDISDLWSRGEYGSAVGKAFEFGTESIASSFGYQVPSAIGALGGYGLAAAGLAGGIAAPLLATLGGLGAMYATFLSSDIERAAQAGAVDTDDLDLLKVMTAAGGQTALNSLSYLLLGGGAVAKGALGAGLSKEGKDLALTSFGKMVNKLDNMHPVKQAAAVLLEEEVAEVGQQALERMAAGLDVSPTDEQARDEYVEIMLATLFPGAGFGIGKAGISAFQTANERNSETYATRVKALSGESGRIAEENYARSKKDTSEAFQDLASSIELELETLTAADDAEANVVPETFIAQLALARDQLKIDVAEGKARQSELDKMTREVNKARKAQEKRYVKDIEDRNKAVDKLQKELDKARASEVPQIEAEIERITAENERVIEEFRTAPEREAAEARRLAEQGVDQLRTVTREDIVETANSRNIEFDNDPAFMVWMSQVAGPDGKPIGKFEIDKLDAGERLAVLRVLERLPKQPVPVGFSGATPEQAEALFAEAVSRQKKASAPLRFAKILNIPRGIDPDTRRGIVDNYIERMEEMGLVQNKLGTDDFFVKTDLNPALEEQYQKVAPLIRDGRFPSLEEVFSRTDIRDPDVVEELRLAAIARENLGYTPSEVSNRYYLSVDGVVDPYRAFSTLADAREAANSELVSDVKSVEVLDGERRIPVALRRPVPEKRVEVVERPESLYDVSEVDYKVSNRGTGAWEVLDVDGNRVALRSSKKKADQFITGNGSGRVDVIVNGERIGSAKTRPQAQKLRQDWISKKQSAAYQAAYDSSMAQPRVSGFPQATREDLANKAGKKAADEIDNEYETKYQFVPASFTSNKVPGFTVSESRVSDDGRRSAPRITQVFPTKEDARSYIDSSKAAAEGPTFLGGREIVDPAELSRVQAARADREAAILAETAPPDPNQRREFPAEAIQAVPEIPEARVASYEIPLSQPVRSAEFDPNVVPPDPRGTLATPALTRDERNARIYDEAVRATREITGQFPASRIPSDARTEELAAQAERSVIGRLDALVRGVESGEIQIDPESEFGQKYNRQKISEENKSLLLREAAIETPGNRAEWIENLDKEVQAISSRVGLPVKVKLYEKKGSQESAAEFLTESMVIQIAVDSDLEGKSTQEQLAAIEPFLNHEFIHVSRRLGLIKASEWAKLTDYVEKTPISQESLARINDAQRRVGGEIFPEGTTYLDFAFKFYAAQGTHQADAVRDRMALQSGALTQAQYDAVRAERQKRNWIKDDYVEEAVARLFQDYTAEGKFNLAQANKNAPEVEKSVFKKILNWFRQVGNAIRKRGNPSTVDIFSTLAAEGELKNRLDRGKALDTWWLRRVDSDEFARLRQVALNSNEKFPNPQSPDSLVSAQAKAEGEEVEASVTPGGVTDEEFAVAWVSDASKSSPETRKSRDFLPNEELVRQSNLPVRAPQSADPRGVRESLTEGDIENYTWGEFPFNRFGNAGRPARVVVKEGYTEEVPSTGQTFGMGREFLESSTPDVQANTTFTNWEDLVTGAFQRITPQLIKSGEFTISAPDQDRVVLVWNDPRFENPVAITLDYVKDYNSDASGNASNDYWSVVGLRADGGYALPKNPYEISPELRGPDVSASAVVAAERPDLVEPITQREIKRYSLDSSTEKHTPETRAAMNTVMGNLPPSRKTLWQAVSSALPEIDNRTIDRLRQLFFDKYNRLWRTGLMLGERGDMLQLADTSAHAAALMVDRAAALFARSLMSGNIVFERPQDTSGGREFDGTSVVRPLALENSASGVVVGFDPQDPGRTRTIDVQLGGRDGYQQPTGGLIPILSLLTSPDKNLVEEFFNYSRSLRALRLKIEGRARGDEWSWDVIQKNLELAERYPEIAIAHKNLQNWNNRLVDFLEATGSIPSWMAEEWKKYGDYTPFYVDLENMQSDLLSEGEQRILNLFGNEFDNTETQAIANSLVTGEPSERLKTASGMDKMMSPIEAISKNAMKLMTVGLKNVARNRAIRDQQILGDKGPEEKNDLANKLDGPKAGAVKTIRNGVVEYWDIVDPMTHEILYGSFNGRNPGLDSFSKVFSMPANVLREGVTRAPDFILRNLNRDSVNAWLLGVDAPDSPGGLPLIGTLNRYGRNLKLQLEGKATGEYETLQDYGSVGGFELLGVSPKKLQRIFQTKIEDRKGVKQKAINFWDKWGEASARSEATVREQTYLHVLRETKRQLRNKGYTDQAEIERLAMSEAAFQAMEVLNFSRRGSSSALQFFTAAIPFLNARLQGLDRLARAYTQGESPNSTLTKDQFKKVFLQRMGIMAAATGALALWNYGDEDYEDLRKEQRDDNFMLKLPKWGGEGSPRFISIPIPFELGIIGKVIPEQIARAFMKYFDGVSGEDIMGEMTSSGWRAITSTLLLDPMGFALTDPFYEAVINNKSKYTGRSIVPVWLENADPEFQRRADTGSTVQNVRNLTDFLTGGLVDLSPLQVEHLVRGYTGTLGMYGLMLSDFFADRVLGDTDFPIIGEVGKSAPPLMAWTSYPVLRSIVATGVGGGQKADYYENIARDVEEVVLTLNRIKEEGNPRQYREYLLKNRGILAKREIVREVDKVLKALREVRDQTTRGGGSVAGKRQRLNEIRARERDILTRINRL